MGARGPSFETAPTRFLRMRFASADVVPAKRSAEPGRQSLEQFLLCHDDCLAGCAVPDLIRDLNSNWQKAPAQGRGGDRRTNSV